jgi:hypothetical protein
MMSRKIRGIIRKVIQSSSSTPSSPPPPSPPHVLAGFAACLLVTFALMVRASFPFACLFSINIFVAVVKKKKKKERKEKKRLVIN